MVISSVAKRQHPLQRPFTFMWLASSYRHNTYHQECTGHRDIGYVSTCHDLKLLRLRFALECSFSDESGGAGPQFNMHFLPYLLHVALYVLNTTRSSSREEKILKSMKITNHTSNIFSPCSIGGSGSQRSSLVSHVITFTSSKCLRTSCMGTGKYHRRWSTSARLCY